MLNKKQKIIINWIDKYLLIRIIVNDIGFVISFSSVLFDISSERALILRAGIKRISNQGDNLKKVFTSIKSDFIIL